MKKQVVQEPVKVIQAPEIVDKRSMWGGSMGIGLINMNVKLIGMTNDKTVRFKQLHKKDLQLIKHKNVCEKDGEEVPKDEIVKGYEYAKGQFVVFEESELDAVRSPSDKMIHIDKFVDWLSLDPMYFGSSYIVVPDKSSVAYNLMYEALLKTGKAGVGKVAIRTKEFPMVVHPYGEGLVLTTMRYADEIVKPDNIAQLQNKAPVGEKEIKLAVEIIKNLDGTFDINEYKDTTREKVKKLVEMKRSGKTIIITTDAKKDPESDLMAQLTATLKASKKGKK